MRRDGCKKEGKSHKKSRTKKQNGSKKREEINLKGERPEVGQSMVGRCRKGRLKLKEQEMDRTEKLERRVP